MTNIASIKTSAGLRIGLFLTDARHNKFAFLAALAVGLLLFAAMAHAGTTGTEFQGIYTKVKDWTGGYLGKSIALFAFLLGLGMGAARGSPVIAVSGVVFALFVAFGPAVIEGIATAVM